MSLFLKQLKSKEKVFIDLEIIHKYWSTSGHGGKWCTQGHEIIQV